MTESATGVRAAQRDRHAQLSVDAVKHREKRKRRRSSPRRGPKAPRRRPWFAENLGVAFVVLRLLLAVVWLVLHALGYAHALPR